MLVFIAYHSVYFRKDAILPMKLALEHCVKMNFSFTEHSFASDSLELLSPITETHKQSAKFFM